MRLKPYAVVASGVTAWRWQPRPSAVPIREYEKWQFRVLSNDSRCQGSKVFDKGQGAQDESTTLLRSDVRLYARLRSVAWSVLLRSLVQGILSSSKNFIKSDANFLRRTVRYKCFPDFLIEMADGWTSSARYKLEIGPLISSLEYGAQPSTRISSPGPKPSLVIASLPGVPAHRRPPHIWIHGHREVWDRV